MRDVPSDTDLFRGLSPDAMRRLRAIGHSRALAPGEYLFLLGDSAECLYVVAAGSIDLCLPMRIGHSVEDIPVESAAAGRALGWSALVKPYRFTLSARAAETADVIAFARTDLQQLFETQPDLGNRLLANLSELVGVRLLTFQTLWVRELQRALVTESEHQARRV